MPPATRKLFIKDIRLLHVLEVKLRRSIMGVQPGVDAAVNSVWSQAEGEPARSFSEWAFSPGHDGWVTANALGVGGLVEQTIYFDMFEGSLFVGGQKLGRLPDEYTQQGFFRAFFGNRVFLTYPSSLPGMLYQLATPFQGHQIHFGFRDMVPILRARTASQVFEFIPPEMFRGPPGGGTPDLPLPLIDECVHWLDLTSQAVTIRPLAAMWQFKPSNWTIDLRTSQAWRNALVLVDPRSPTFNRVATVLEPFENGKRMIIFQPERNNLVVQLPALELSFRVNSAGLLQSQQLRAVVDINQDAGTLYGLDSSLVLRDTAVPEERSIIVVMGSADIIHRGGRVRIVINHDGFYARFTINKTLGRLECAAEPRLIYFKAYCHAITASALPDPLTGRTGTAEAISCLRAGSAQPWAPVDAVSYRILSALAELTPRRVYYPENFKILQKITWSDNLSYAVQDDRFAPLIRDIIDQCRVLHPFHLGSEAPPKDNRVSDDYLANRAHYRNQTFQASHYRANSPVTADFRYVARDRIKTTSFQNTYEATTLVKQWSQRVAVSRDIAAVMQEWPRVLGYNDDFSFHLFTELINFDFASQWGSLYRFCQEASEMTDKYKLMFLFATMAFDVQVDMTLVRSFIAIAVMDDFRVIKLPQWPEFMHFRRGQIPTVDLLMQFLQPYGVPYPDDERTLLPIAMHPKQRRKLENAQRLHEKKSEDSCKALAQHLLSQWPCREPSLGTEIYPYFDCEGAFLAIKAEWARLFDNYELSEHLRRVQAVLNKCTAPEHPTRPDTSETEQEFFSTPTTTCTQPTIHDLLPKLKVLAQHNVHAGVPLGNITNLDAEVRSNDGVTSALIPLSGPPHAQPQSLGAALTENSSLIAELKGIIRPFANSEDPVRRVYGADLQGSLEAFARVCDKTPQRVSVGSSQLDALSIENKISNIQRVVHQCLDSICTALRSEEEWLETGGMLPYLTPMTVLEILPTLATSKTMSIARDAILKYAEQITDLQHLQRVRSAIRRQDTIQLATETANSVRAMWKPKDHVEWLLLEIDFNLRIRQDQYEVAQAMLSPNTTSSFVLQMNMGQGKSSVVIPMLVTELANSQNLARVVIPRSLLLQTAQLLQTRLGGLINRKIKHVPFSRRSSTEISSLKMYHQIHTDTLQSRGVILTLPEHMLSFKLSGETELSNGHTQQADTMIKIQDWLSKKCRDILDECDHMLAVKTQLIYPSGSQKMVDGHPGRWKVVQDLLKLIKPHLAHLRRDFPRGIEVIQRSPGTFPTIYLLHPDAKDALIRRLTDSVLKGEGGILPIGDCSEDELACVSSFLRDAQFSKATAPKVAGVFKGKTDARQQLLLLRGLLIHRILLMGLSKRWNVQYGIHPQRDPIAVPFRSKGIPSDQAEFGHPDVSILLTCLSFYYSGLTFPQFQQILTLLHKSDEPVQEFESWFRDLDSFPEALRSWHSVNIDDETQCTQLWNYLRQQTPVVNYYLNRFVFPRHARTFERKLVSSGWDIATDNPRANDPSTITLQENITPGAGTNKKSIAILPSSTVGFSGTNDNRTLLPLNVAQNDLPSLYHTNAEVLTYLLQPRNRRYVQIADRYGKRVPEIAFLRMLHLRGIRMMLDAGAQILELDNFSLAKKWLEIDKGAEAAVYFGEDGKARVVHRDGRGLPLAGSPFLNNLGACVVYLDEVRSRRLMVLFRRPG